MIEIPTDRLHKFLAIGGLIAICAGIFFSLDRYNEYSLMRIKTYTKAREFYSSFQTVETLRESVTRMRETRKKLNKREAVEYLDKEIDFLDEKHEREIDNMIRLIRESREMVELTNHYKLMSYIWFSLSAILLTLGMIFSYFGFKKWLSQPKKSQ